MSDAQQETMGENPETDPQSVWSYRGYELDVSHFTTAMVHLYRAEVSKANLWRSRLDTTTNWSVVTAGAALTFAFSAPENPHFVLLLVMILMLTFLVIEARRYSYYVLWYHRVRLMETDFFATMITPPYRPPEDWDEALVQTLEEPAFLIPLWRSVGIRYRRNYVWMVTLVIVSWILKLSIHPAPIGEVSDIISRARISIWLPGPLVLGGVAALYVGMLGLMVATAIVRARQGKQASRPIGFRREPNGRALLKRNQLAHIITSKPELVSKRIIKELHRSATAIEGRGMYSGARRDVLLCAIPGSAEKQLRSIVKEVDPSAFIILSEAHDPLRRRFRPMTPAEPPM